MIFIFIMLLIFLVNMLGSFFWKTKKVLELLMLFLKKAYVSLDVQQIKYELIKEWILQKINEFMVTRQYHRNLFNL